VPPEHNTRIPAIADEHAAAAGGGGSKNTAMQASRGEGIAAGTSADMVRATYNLKASHVQ